MLVEEFSGAFSLAFKHEAVPSDLVFKLGSLLSPGVLIPVVDGHQESPTNAHTVTVGYSIAE